MGTRAHTQIHIKTSHIHACVYVYMYTHVRVRLHTHVYTYRLAHVCTYQCSPGQRPAACQIRSHVCLPVEQIPLEKHPRARLGVCMTSSGLPFLARRNARSD